MADGSQGGVQVVGGEVGVALLVVFALICMDGAIEFDHQFGDGAVEVEDVGAEGLLTAEAVAVELTGAEMLPEILLGRGLATA